MVVHPPSGEQGKQEDCKFKASLRCLARTTLSQKTRPREGDGRVTYAEHLTQQHTSNGSAVLRG